MALNHFASYHFRARHFASITGIFLIIASGPDGGALLYDPYNILLHQNKIKQLKKEKEEVESIISSYFSNDEIKNTVISQNLLPNILNKQSLLSEGFTSTVPEEVNISPDLLSEIIAKIEKEIFLLRKVIDDEEIIIIYSS